MGRKHIILSMIRDDAEEFWRLLKNETEIDSSLTHHPDADYNMPGIKEVLEKAGAFVDHRFRKSLLHIAVAFQNIKFVKLLIEAGYDINSRNKRQETVLHVAVSNEIEESYVWLTEQEKGKWIARAVNTVDKVCNESLIKFLLDHGADVNCVDKDGRSPLHCAAEVENPSIARMILTNGARVDKADIWGYTPLQIAVMRGTTSIVELLIDNGADIYYKNFNGATSLSLATNREDKETWYDVMKLLLEKKAKCNKISFYATDALNLAIHNCDLRTSKLLLDYGAHLKEDNLKDPGLLFYVMQEDRVDVLDYVLSRGADVSCTIGFSNEDKDHTSLYYAVKHGYSTEIRNVLIKNIAKLVFLNIWVNEKDLEAIKQDYKMKCYYKNCIEELEKMKIRNIYEDISLFNILIKKGMASGYARNENLIEALDSAENQLSHDFPIYYSSLREVFFEEIKKQKLIKGAAIVLNEFFNFYNSFHLANMKILSYLKHEDIIRINETE